MEEERGNKWPRYAVYSLIVIVVLLIILILFLYLIKSPLIFRSGASTLTTSTTVSGVIPEVSPDNSYVFASPLRAKTGGEKIRVTVFVLDSKGLGVSGKKVIIGSGDLLQITPIQPVTDGAGRASFDVSSQGKSGTFIIQAVADGTKLIQTASISFD